MHSYTSVYINIFNRTMETRSHPRPFNIFILFGLDRNSVNLAVENLLFRCICSDSILSSRLATIFDFPINYHFSILPRVILATDETAN